MMNQNTMDNLCESLTGDERVLSVREKEFLASLLKHASTDNNDLILAVHKGLLVSVQLSHLGGFVQYP